jgi:hypothetical protein
MIDGNIIVFFSFIGLSGFAGWLAFLLSRWTGLMSSGIQFTRYPMSHIIVCSIVLMSLIIAVDSYVYMGLTGNIGQSIVDIGMLLSAFLLAWKVSQDYMSVQDIINSLHSCKQETPVAIPASETSVEDFDRVFADILHTDKF